MSFRDRSDREPKGAARRREGVKRLERNDNRVIILFLQLSPDPVVTPSPAPHGSLISSLSLGVIEWPLRWREGGTGPDGLWKRLTHSIHCPRFLGLGLSAHLMLRKESDRSNLLQQLRTVITSLRDCLWAKRLITDHLVWREPA